MIKNVQRPIYYHGFGIAIAMINLETFTNVKYFAKFDYLSAYLLKTHFFTDDSCDLPLKRYQLIKWF